jgi:minor extracellular serine protease Vpr
MALRRVKRGLLCVSFLALAAGAQTPQPAQFVPNQYILLLEDAPVSARFVSREQMRTAAAVGYRQQVETKQAAVRKELASRSFQVLGSVSVLVNAIFVGAPASRVAELESIPGVIGVRPVRRFKMALNRATQLMNAPAAWNAVGGMSNSGKGIKIAILDTGIDQTHPAFQDSTLPMPAGFPICTAGHPEDCAYTTNKVIVARSYVRMLAAGSDPRNPAVDSMPDDFSPRDRDGHGTAVASCAAANSTATPAITTSGGPLTIVGMAPKAYLGNYKITGSPGVLDGASDAVLIQAIEDALADGMDIASLSLGGPSLTAALDTGSICGLANGPTNYCDPVAAAFEAAVKAGMVVVAAAGNDGSGGYYYPTFNSISSPASAPSVIGVGATVNSHVFGPSVSVDAASAPSSLKGIAAQDSDAIFPYANNPSYQVSDIVFPAVSAPLVDVAQTGNDGYACTTLAAGSLNGAFALIERGPASTTTCNFNLKVSNAQAAGAIGVILYMYDSSAPMNPEGMGFYSTNPLLGPVVMISNSAGAALKQYIDQHPGQSVTIDTAGIEQDMATYDQVAGLAVVANQFAGYSSMGPTPDGAIKPDLVATSGFDYDSYDLGPDYNDPDLPVPGAIYLAVQSFDPNGELFSTSRYSAAAAGTSFSTPITAGAAALVKQAHPKYTPAQIKSALVNAAARDTTTDEFGDTVDVEWIGAGRLDAGAAVNASVTAEPSTISFGYVKSGGLPIAKSITITNQGTSSATLAVSAACCSVNGTANSTVSGVTIAFNQQALTLAGGAATTLTVTLSGTVPAASEYSGTVTLQGSGATVRIPFMFLVGDGVAYNLNFVYGSAFEGAPGEDVGAFPVVQVVDQYGVPVAGAAVSLSVGQGGSVTFRSVSWAPACTPNNSTTTASCATDNYGYAWVDLVMGAQVGSPTINVTAAGLTNPIDVYIMAQPTITTAGVVNAASSTGPIAPGSYVSIYGTNLVDTDYLINPIGDGPTLTTANDLPLVIDGTTVSFDVPSAGISVPGYLTFVGPGQVNVQVPWELAGQSSVQMKVTVDDNYLFGNVVSVPLAQYTPSFFVGNGTIAAQDAITYAQILSSNPAHSGEILALYANGLGPVTNGPASGAPAPGGPNLANTTTQPVVMIGGQQAQISFWGLAPGFAGLYQINATVPSGLNLTGNQQVTVSIGGQTSPAVVLPVQ